jgi:periplasmic divalent cation tolerance protein
VKSEKHFVIALVTAPDLKVARRLAKIVLEKRLAACVNLLPGIESHYRWKNKLETSAEVLMILKTTRACLKKLETCILENHPYDTAEFIVLKIGAGAKRYLKWIEDSVK